MPVRPVRSLLRTVGPWPVAALLGVGILLLAMVGRGTWTNAYDPAGLSVERNGPAYYSGAVLLLAALCTALAATLDWGRRVVVAAYAFFALLLAVLSVDEVAALHEQLERWSGVDWQVLYAPVFAAGALSGLIVLASQRVGTPAFALTVAGGSAWVLSQVLEAVQWSGGTLVHPRLVYPEELLEVTGSTLFALAMIAVLRTGPQPAGGLTREQVRGS